MKYFNSCYVPKTGSLRSWLLLPVLLLFAFSGEAQTYSTIIGGTNSTAQGGGPNPFAWGVRGNRSQFVLRQANIGAIPANAYILSLGFEVTTAAVSAKANLPNFTLSVYNSVRTPTQEATNWVVNPAAASYITLLASSTPTTFNVGSTGWKDITFPPFQWAAGTNDNLLIQTCFGQSTSVASGDHALVRRTNNQADNGVFRSRWLLTSATSAWCENTSTSTNTNFILPVVRVGWCRLPTPGNTLASVNPVVCGSTTLSLQNGPTSPETWTYQWQSSPTNTWGSPTNFGSGGTTQAVTPSATTWYRCVATCGGVVQGTSTPIQVVVNAPAPGATLSSATPPLPFCASASTLSLANPQPGLGLTYEWQSSPTDSWDSPTIMGSNPTQAIAPSTTTWYRCVVSCSSPNNSTASTPLEVVVLPPPVATPGSYGPACIDGDAIALGGTGTPAGSGVWSGPGVSGSTFDPASAGPGMHELTYTWTTDLGSCVDAANTSITVDPLPQASAGGSTTICETGSATVSGATLAFGTPAWGHDGAGTLDDANTLTPTYNAVAADANNAVVLTLTVTSNNTCAPATAAPVIYTVNVDPLPAASAGGSTAICVDGSATVTGATASNGTILWTSDGVGSLDDDEELLPTYTPGLGDAGNDVVLTLTVTSNNACNSATDDATFTVTVNPLPVVDAGSIGPLCSVDPDFDLVGSPTGGVWTGTGVSGTGPYVFDPSVGTQTLAYIYTDGNGCTDSDDVSITVIPATTWYADQDGDGFGDPNTTQDACDQPSGYVANNTDNCPTVFGLQGDFCDADPDPNTFALGVLDSNCACTLLPPDLDVTLELRTPDGSSDNITWELVTDVGSQVVCSGGGYPSGITDPITAFCSIPNGCYRLRVQDESGDGVGFGPGGGYQLRLAGPNAQDIRIVDNLGNFSSGVLSAIGNGPAAICFPMASDPKPLYQHRDKLDFVSGQYLISEEDAAVSAVWNPAPNAVQSTNTGYEFWLFDPNGSYSYRRFRNHATSDGFGNVGATRACHMKVNGWFASQAAPANVLLNVRIRTRVNGVNGDWGPAYRFKIDPARAACPLTLLNDFPGNAFESCGQTRTWGGSTLIHARPVSGANRYQWRFRTVGEPLAPIIIRTSNTYFLTLNWTVNPLQPGKTYEVDVRASKTAGATWCTDAVLPALVDPWGTVCLLTIQGSNAQGGGQNLALENSNTNMSLYPNPNRGDQVMLSIDAVDEGVETISVDFFDLAGHRAVARTIPTQGNNLNSLLELNGLAAGVYIVHITAGDKVYTERLVVTQ
jgi:hypothetical protein